MKTKNILIFLALFVVAQSVTAQNNAETVLRPIINQVKNHKNVEMTYNYQLSADGKILGEVEKGHAWMQGEAYRIELQEQQTISDGTTIWSYLIDDEEVMVSNATEGEDNTPLKLLTSLDESYAATLTGVDAKGIATIELANPKGQYKRVTVKINSKKSELKSADIYLEDGSKIVVNIEEMKYDQELDKGLFHFDTKAHPNVDVIDMR